MPPKLVIKDQYGYRVPTRGNPLTLEERLERAKVIQRSAELEILVLEEERKAEEALDRLAKMKAPKPKAPPKQVVAPREASSNTSEEKESEPVEPSPQAHIAEVMEVKPLRSTSIKGKENTIHQYKYSVNQYSLLPDQIDKMAKQMMEVVNEHHTLQLKNIRAIFESNIDDSRHIDEIWLGVMNELNYDSVVKKLRSIYERRIASESPGIWLMINIELQGVTMNANKI
jgi:hypothetical protein